VCPAGYRRIDAPRSSSGCTSAGQRGGGIVLIYRDSIVAKRIAVDAIPRTFEFILTMLKISRSNVIVFSVYRTGPVTVDFYDELTSVLELLIVHSCPVLITGDFNIHLDDPRDKDAIKFNDILDSFGLVQSVHDPTHLQGRTLDAIITRKDLPLPDICVGLPGEFSDHSLLISQLQLPRPPVCFVDVSTRAWKGFNEDNFRRELLASGLCLPPAAYSGIPVDELQERYDTTLRALLDKHAPCRTARSSVEVEHNHTSAQDKPTH